MSLRVNGTLTCVVTDRYNITHSTIDPLDLNGGISVYEVFLEEARMSCSSIKAISFQFL